jgi:ATP-dependent helicase/nuclease subunit B
MKNIYYIPATESFVDSLAQGFFEKFADYGNDFSDIKIFLPNMRSIAEFKKSLMRQRAKHAFILPQIIAIGEDDQQVAKNNIIGQLEQKLLIIQEIHNWQENHNVDLFTKNNGLGFYNFKAVLSLADSLILLLNEFEKEGINLARIRDVIPSFLSNHYQLVLSFLENFQKNWKKTLKENHKTTFVAQRNITIQQTIKNLKNSKHPIIIAGTTATIASTKNLMQEVATLPKGYVILPLLDKASLNKDLLESHPMHNLQTLLTHLKITTDDINSWSEFKPSNRQLLIDNLLGNNITLTQSAIDNICLFEANSSEEEITNIALLLRESLDRNSKCEIAIITNDQALPIRLNAILAKWQIYIPHKKNLAHSQEAIFFNLIANFCDAENFSKNFINLIKHPFLLNEQSYLIEKRIYQKQKIVTNFAELYSLLPEIELVDYVKNIAETLKPLLQIFNYKNSSLTQIISTQRKVVKSLYSDAENIIGDFLDDLYDKANLFSKIDIKHYADFLHELILSEVILPNEKSNIHFLTPIEARLKHYDLTIITGLNEGTWPTTSNDNIWLSNQMRSQIGLISNNKKLALSHSDFLNHLAAPNLVLSRAKKTQGKVKLKSRWLIEIELLLKKNNLLLLAETKYQKYWQLLNQVKKYQPIEPCSACPPAAARIRKLSATQIERLIKDPYGIYAQKILHLKKLERNFSDINGADFGNAVHSALENFSNNYDNIDPQERLEKLLEYGEKSLNKHVSNKLALMLWRPRFSNIAKWFINIDENIRKKLPSIVSELYLEANLLDQEDFILNAKIDRLAMSQQNIIISDYKTSNTAISIKNAKIGINPQLVLEALLIQDKYPELNITQIDYWLVTGKTTMAGEIKKLFADQEEIADLLDETKTGLQNFIKVFLNGKTPLLAIPDENIAPNYNDYTHLERIKEWQLGNV